MANPSVVIDIAAEYTGKKAFDKASKSTNKLEGAVASLAKKMAIAFSVTALLKFGKNAVKETLARCRKPVRARMHNENIASQRLFDRLGFTFFSNDNENIGYSWHYLF